MEIIEMSNVEFMSKFGPSLAKHASDVLQAIHTPGENKTFSMENLLRKPFNAQEEAIQAISKALYKEDLKTVFVIGEQGVGKTLIAAGVAAVSPRPMRVLVLCPPHLVRKWIKEISGTVEGCKVFNLNGKDALSSLMLLEGKGKPSTHEFYVLGREKAKGHYRVRPAYVMQRYPYCKSRQIACPKCGQIQVITNLDRSFSYLTEEDLLKQLKCTALKKKRVKDGTGCVTDGKDRPVVCGEPLYGPLRGGEVFRYKYETNSEKALEGNITGIRRYSLAEYVKRRLKKRFDLLILDEVHEYKGESMQGDAMGKLASSCKKTLCLTGTLTGGYASDIFYLFWRTTPMPMKKDGFKFADVSEWMEKYGTVEKRTREDKKTLKKRTVSRNCPGISPLIFSKFLIERAIFLKLADVVEGLPPYVEEVRLVEMRPDQKKVYKKMMGNFAAALKFAGKGKKGGKGKFSFLFSKYLHAALSWPDRSFEPEVVVVSPVNKEGVEESREVCRAAALAGVFPKEEELLEIVNEERRNNRRVLVYCTYTGKRDVTERLKFLLEGKGWKCAILKPDTVKAEGRTSWIEAQVENENIDVLIANPELVKTGLDLLDFPRIVFYQQGYNIYTLRQASRRSWRIGQTEPVRITYLAYKGSLQENALTLIASKIETAFIAEGDISESGLYGVSESPDSIIRELANAIMDGSIENMESAATAWGRARKREIQTNLFLGEDGKTNASGEGPTAVGEKKIKVDVYEENAPGSRKVSRITVTDISNVRQKAQLVLF